MSGELEDREIDDPHQHWYGHVGPPDRVLPKILRCKSLTGKKEKTEGRNIENQVQIALVADCDENKKIVQEHYQKDTVKHPEEYGFLILVFYKTQMVPY